MNEALITGTLLFTVVAVGLWAWRYNKPTDITKIAAEQLRQARILALEHRAAAEEHKAMSDMYEQRVKRLEGQE